MKKSLTTILNKILASYARFVIARHKPFVIAITGSTGKTSTKEAVYQVLSDHFGAEEVRKNFGNLNSEIGLPMTILGYTSYPLGIFWPIFLLGALRRLFVKKYPKYLVLEMGIDNPRGIESLCEIVKPNMAAVTGITGAHLANFRDLGEYQQEKLKIFKYLSPAEKGFVNIDDQHLARLDELKLTTIAVKNKDADFRAENIKLSSTGTEFDVVSTGKKTHVNSRLLGEHLVYADLFAFAIASSLGIQTIQIAKSLEKIHPYSGRMNPLLGKNNVQIIDDTYNANPSSVLAAAMFLDSLVSPLRKVMILGNMNELGAAEVPEHLAVAEQLKQTKIDHFVLAGPNAESMAKVIGDRAVFYIHPALVIKNLGLEILAGDLVLVKASQNNNYFEEITKVLMQDPKKADEFLVRQGKKWSSVKNKFYKSIK
ncbi:MAG: UDP-N-acetylmuramoyl-tripeptide--D-alanyl-D-alanine ligase [Candidatus Berkelbacteria bacterium]